MNRVERQCSSGLAPSATDAASLIELACAQETEDHSATLHACMLMNPQDLSLQRLKDVSETQTLLILGTNRVPYAVALTRWRQDICFLDYICSSVPRCGRRLFHYLMFIAHARNATCLILNSIPELTGMYTKWGCGSVTNIDKAGQTFTFNVRTYVSHSDGPAYAVAKNGVHIILYLP